MIAVILAAGLGTRMRSELPKVMHPVADRPMIDHVVQLALDAGATTVAVVVGYRRELVEEHLRRTFPGAPLRFCVQEQMRGTGDAVRSSRQAWATGDDRVLVLCGDVPNVPAQLVAQLLDQHVAGGHPASLVTAIAPPGTAYGRIVRAPDGAVRAIVEWKDATDEQREIREINTGLYVFEAAFLRDHIDGLDTNNAQGELYLTDLIAVAAAAPAGCGCLVAPDITALDGVNTPDDLKRADAVARQRATATA